MASKIDVPGTGQDVDPTDPFDVGMTLALLVGGFMVLTIASVLGRNAADGVFSTVASTIGYDPSGGQAIEIV